MVDTVLLISPKPEGGNHAVGQDGSGTRTTAVRGVAPGGAVQPQHAVGPVRGEPADGVRYAGALRAALGGRAEERQPCAAELPAQDRRGDACAAGSRALRAPDLGPEKDPRVAGAAASGDLVACGEHGG